MVCQELRFNGGIPQTANNNMQDISFKVSIFHVEVPGILVNHIMKAIFDHITYSTQIDFSSFSTCMYTH